MTVPHKPFLLRYRAAPLIILLASAVMGLAYGLHLFSGRWLAASWQEQLETVPEEQVKILVDRIGQMEENGFPVLIRALDSPRESVARAAKRRLWQEIGQWEGLRRRDASQKAAVLAQALLDQAESLSPNGRQNAADVAARILDWPIDDEVVRTRNVMGACERVIRLSNQPQPLWSARRNRPANVEEQLSLESARGGAADADARDGAVKQLTYLSGGGLPIVSSLDTSAENKATGSEPARSPLQEAKETEPSAEQATLTTKSPDQPGAQEPAKLALSIGRPLSKTSSAGRDLLDRGTASPSAEGGDSKQLLLTDTVELMRRLRAESADSARVAQEELQRRGFSEVHFELARQMFDPDPEVRRQLARTLPQLRSVNATPWLVWLCRDRDAEVRLLAITVLATSNDPRVIAQVERIARLDDDPRIQEQAQRLARHRGDSEGQSTRLR